MRAIFISDLHLHERDAATQSRFDAFMRTIAPGADHLYVLGDLLHAWLGDALLDGDVFAQQITSQFRALALSGTRVHIARGNRDFMIGNAFVKSCNASLLDAQTVIELGGKRVLMMHGDEMCIDDIRYQRARRVLRSDTFRVLGNSLPRFIRFAIARKLRRESEDHKGQTAMSIMDANIAAITKAMTQHSATVIVHGHTHRPAHHAMPGGWQRWVLSDWQQEYGYLEWNDGCFAVHPWPQPDA